MGEDAGGTDATWLFGLFAALLAVSLILHQLWWEGFEVLSVHFVVVLAALWTILRPTSVARFAVLLAAEVLSVTLDMPEVGSHTLLVLVSSACVLAHVAWTSLPARRLPDPATLFRRIAPFLRVQLLVVYAAAAVAKMNTGFFDAGISCAVSLSARVAWFDPSLLGGSWRVAPAMWGTVLTELALVALLAIARTRVLGLAVGGAFHAVLALAGNVPFSALALALYVVFLPVDTPGRLRTVAAGRPALGRWFARARRWAASPVAFPAAVGGWLAAAVLFSREAETGRFLISNGTRIFLVVLVVGAASVLTLALAGGRPWLQPPRSLRLGQAVFVVGIGLLVANGLSPYLGLKTESSFTMFSNLHTEPGLWNHAVIPEVVRVFDPQERLVRVIDSNDPALEQRTRNGARMVRFELERYVRLRPGTRATYAMAGATHEPVRTTRSGLAEPWAAPILDRVAKFRDVRPPQRGGC